MTFNLASVATQRAVYAALNGLVVDPTTSAGVPVYDEVPEGASFPYIAVGPAMTTSVNRFGRRGRVVIQQIDVWGRSGADASQDGWLQTKSIAGAIDTLLDWTQPNASDGWNFVSCLFHQAQEKVEADGITRCLVVEYQFVLEVTTPP